MGTFQAIHLPITVKAGLWDGGVEIVERDRFVELVAERNSAYIPMISSFLPNRAFFLFDFERDRVIYIDLNFGKRTIHHKASQFSELNKAIKKAG